MKRLAARLLVAVALAGAAFCVAAPAAAQNAAQARRFAAAQKLFDGGAYTPALQEFKALAAETGSPNAELYVARCLRELGKLVEAHEALSIAFRDASAKADADPKYGKTRNAAAADLTFLESKLAKLVIAVPSPPPGMRVTLDGAPVAPERLGAPLVALPGNVVVRLSAPGAADVERRVALKAGETTTLALSLDAAAATPATPAAASAPQAPPVDAPPAQGAARGGGARIAGVVVLVLGAGGMVTFAVAGEMANHRYDTINAACGGKRCTDPSFASQIQGGRQLDLAANVGLGVGIAGLVGGALLVALGGPKAAPVSAGAWVAPGGGGFLGGARGAF